MNDAITLNRRLVVNHSDRRTLRRNFSNDSGSEFMIAYISVVIALAIIFIMTAYINDVILLVSLVSVFFGLVSITIGSYARDVYAMDVFIEANGGVDNTANEIENIVSKKEGKSSPRLRGQLMPRMGLEDILSLT